MNKRLYRKKLPFFSIFLLIFLAYAASGAFAWFTAVDQKTNSFQVSWKGLHVSVVDNFHPTGSITVGSIVPKEVSAKNTGTKLVFVRILVLPVITATGLEDNDRVIEAVIGKNLELDGFDSSKWIDGGDGYFYYLDVLEPGETIQPSLFTGIRLTEPLSPEYGYATLDIQVKTEAIEISPYLYRDAWWEGTVPSAGALSIVDQTLSGKVKP